MTAAATTPTKKVNPVKEQPLWTVPAILGILMVSSGAMFVLIAQGVKILSSL